MCVLLNVSMRVRTFDRPYSRLLVSVGLIASALLAGCSSMAGRAKSAYDAGDYERAVELYAQARRDDPDDPVLVREERRARDRWLRERYDRVTRLASAWKSDAAREALVALLKSEGDILAQSSTATQAARRRAIALVMRSMTKDVDRMLADNDVLGAKLWLDRADVRKVEGPLADAAHELAERIQKKGQARCQTLASSSAARAPHSRRLVGRYCAEFGVSVQSTAPPPESSSMLVVTGEISPAAGNTTADLMRAIARAHRSSPWYSASSPKAGTAKLAGTVVTKLSSKPIRVSRPWVEHIPYEATETVNVPYTESVPTTVTRSVRVPYTDYERTYEPCPGDPKQQCERSRPVVKYRWESRPHTEMQTRTRYRQETRTVTKMREEQRTFDYDATEFTASRSASIALSIDLRQPGTQFEVRREYERLDRSVAHDASFPKAGVHPQKAELASNAAWGDEAAQKFEVELSQALRQAYARAFCQGAHFDFDAAARCLHAGRSGLPPEAMARLTEVFGVETKALISLVD